ncbi:MAG: DitJ-like CoA ligase forming, related to diterpenoid metabolism [Pseudonocardiales bacterium]|nr:DitJ-like CoA ligase forming, related to diterpenoid metabolism [Pseudonocardiales bacterium]
MRTYEGLTVPFADPNDWTLAKVLRQQAGARPDSIYLDAVEEGEKWTYAEVLEISESVASSLLDSGLEAGDRVLIQAANSSQLVFTWFAAAVGAMVEVPINTAYEFDFLSHQVRTADPRAAVIDDVFAQRFVDIAADCDNIKTFWVIDTGELDSALKVLRASGWKAEPFEALKVRKPVELPETGARDLGAIFFTSGTTGPSKGVAMSHSQFYFDAVECVNLTRLTADDAYMVTTPLFHGNAQWLAAYPALVAGARFVMRRKFSASRWVDHVRESGVTVTNFLGVMMDFVWKQPPRDDDADNPLRCIFAAPTASSIVAGFRDRFGIEAFVEVFGLTEVSMPILSPYGEDRPAGAAGLLVSEWFELQLVNPETDEEVAVGEVGEMVVRSKFPWTMSSGYYGMPEKTVEAWRNLWFHSGDALRRDEDGWYYFVDRYKDALRRRGENISSYEVEQGVLAHPAVLECAVIAVPASMEAGEDEVMACVVAPGGVDPKELWEFTSKRVPTFAVPRFIRVMDKLPRTPSEKIQKLELRNEGITADTYDHLA